MSYVTMQLIHQLWNFEFLAEDSTSNNGSLLPLVNTFATDTDKYYLRCYKVNDTKTFKNLIVSFYALCS